MTEGDRGRASASWRGLQLFAKYAYPPNELGYCGPADHRALLDYGTSGVVDAGLVELARGFPGPWPYLTVMAGAAGIKDPFDVRLVEAYWVGNEFLDRVETADFGRMVEDYFKPRTGRRFSQLVEGVPAGAVAHHSFHVFGVYPWMGLLKSGYVEEPLEKMDRCRIRWGQVVGIDGDRVSVHSRPLCFEAGKLGLGPIRSENVVRALHGQTFLDDLEVGDWVSMHWDWVCDKLDRRQLANLRRYTRHQFAITNHGVAHSGPGMVLA